MPLLRFESAQDEQNGIAVSETQTPLQFHRCCTSRIESIEIAAILNDNDLFRRQTLRLGEVARVGLGDGDIVIQTPAHEPIDYKARFQPAPPPMLPQMRCFENDTRPAQP